MALNIKTGFRGVRQFPNEEIVILVSSVHVLQRNQIPFVFTDRHAVLTTAQIYDDVKDLDQVDWEILRNRDFARDPEDPRKFERYEAETLIHRHLPVASLLGLACYNDTAKSVVSRHAAIRGAKVPIFTEPSWYF
jgi:hypothetical protein